MRSIARAWATEFAIGTMIERWAPGGEANGLHDGPVEAAVVEQGGLKTEIRGVRGYPDRAACAAPASGPSPCVTAAHRSPVLRRRACRCVEPDRPCDRPVFCTPPYPWVCRVPRVGACSGLGLFRAFRPSGRKRCRSRAGDTPCWTTSGNRCDYVWCQDGRIGRPFATALNVSGRPGA